MDSVICECFAKSKKPFQFHILLCRSVEMLDRINSVLNFGIEPEVMSAGHSTSRSVICDLDHAAVHRVMHFQDRARAKDQDQAETCLSHPALRQRRLGQAPNPGPGQDPAASQAYSPGPGPFPVSGQARVQPQAKSEVHARAQAQAQAQAHSQTRSQAHKTRARTPTRLALGFCPISPVTLRGRARETQSETQ